MLPAVQGVLVSWQSQQSVKQFEEQQPRISVHVSIPDRSLKSVLVYRKKSTDTHSLGSQIMEYKHLSPVFTSSDERAFSSLSSEWSYTRDHSLVLL